MKTSKLRLKLLLAGLIVMSSSTIQAKDKYISVENYERVLALSAAGQVTDSDKNWIKSVSTDYIKASGGGDQGEIVPAHYVFNLKSKLLKEDLKNVGSFVRRVMPKGKSGRYLYGDLALSFHKSQVWFGFHSKYSKDYYQGVQEMARKNVDAYSGDTGGAAPAVGVDIYPYVMNKRLECNKAALNDDYSDLESGQQYCTVK
jgi:hypothetical protein